MTLLVSPLPPRTPHKGPPFEISTAGGSYSRLQCIIEIWSIFAIEIYTLKSSADGRRQHGIKLMGNCREAQPGSPNSARAIYPLSTTINLQLSRRK